MKKSVLAAALAGVMLLSGCSGVSQDDYNSLLEENSKLKESSSSSESTSSETSTSIATKSSFSSESNVTQQTNNGVNSVPESLSSECQNDIFKYDDFTNGDIDIYTNSTTGNKWYHNSMGTFVSYIEENSYSKKTDDELVVHAYHDMIYGVTQYPTNLVPLYIFAISDKSGYCIARGMLTIVEVDGENEVITSLDWYSDYTRLNTNAKHIELFGNSDSSSNTSDLENSTSSSSSSSLSVPTESQTPPDKDNVTTGERNALKEAQAYLKYSAFSRDGLIGQLEYEGYTNSEATYGADNVGADWNEQAVKSAGEYLEYSAFSYSGLIKQLEYEKFTHEQAVYGADNCGADWNEQAVKCAAEYLEYSSFSKDGLIGQLEFEGFTHDQAVYGAEQNGY